MNDHNPAPIPRPIRGESRQTIVFILALVTSFFYGALPAWAESRTAVAEIFGCTDPSITGTAWLSERRSKGGVKVVDVSLFVSGLSDGKHAVHIHETADCTPCTEAGGHFDPGPNSNPSPDGNHPFHSGDLVNIDVKNGRGFLHTVTSRVTLARGPLRILDENGSAFTIHVNPDTFCPDGPVTGCAGGDRIACGIIESFD